MSDRRKFIIQSSMATSALLAAKPVKSLHKLNSLFPSLMGHGNSILLLHTDAASPNTELESLVNKIQKLNRNSFWVTPALLENQPYKILKSGNIRLGLVGVGKNLKKLSKISSTATMLKNEKNCQIVVCLSDLACNGKKKDEDMKLAALSENIDVILGGNHCPVERKQQIVLNRNKEEVIINHASVKGVAIGGIEIGFDNNGKKNRLAFKNKLINSVRA